MLKKRNLFFIGMYDGYFRLTYVFGDKAVAAIQNSDVSKESIKELLSARKYAEGRGISFEIRDATHLDDVKKLILLKIAN